eukprot:363309-Chlamydomonas_euryale.AAC.27
MVRPCAVRRQRRDGTRMAVPAGGDARKQALACSLQVCCRRCQLSLRKLLIDAAAAVRHAMRSSAAEVAGEA